MALDPRVKDRIDRLLLQAGPLSQGYGQFGHARDANQVAECTAWVAAAANIARLVVDDPSNPYRIVIDREASKGLGSIANNVVKTVSLQLRRLVEDAEAGFIGSPSDLASAATFDDLLDHAQAYLDDGRKDPAGVLAGVVFEDSARRVFRKISGQDDAGRELDSIINFLKANAPGNPTISGTQAKRAKVAAHVRTQSTHAQWGGFDQSDVEETIKFTREFVDKHLG